MPAASNPTPDEVVTLQMAESYRFCFFASGEYWSRLAEDNRRKDRIIEGLREQLA